MKEFIEEYFKNVNQYPEFQQFDLLDKKIINFILDTKNICFDQMGIQFIEKKNPKVDILILINELKTFLETQKNVYLKDLVILKQVKKRYSNIGMGMVTIDLRLQSGSIIGLVGENGNGKTTLLRVLAQELTITSGSINYNYEHKDLHDLRTQLIFIPQKYKSLPEA